MELRVNDYVRTEKGEIGKVSSIAPEDIGFGDMELCNTEPYVYGTIIKSSPNIIDLIEVGDIVNDEKIIDIGCLTNGPEEGTKVIDYYIAPNTVYYLKNEDIKSIVTKEQFKNMEYEVK